MSKALDYPNGHADDQRLTRDQWKRLEVIETEYISFCQDTQHALDHRWSISLELSGPYFIGSRPRQTVSLALADALSVLNARRRSMEDQIRALGGNPQELWARGDWQAAES